MGRLVRSYLDYARGQSGRFSPWSVSLPLDWLARGWVRCRNGAFDRGILEQVEPPLPVVSVGNMAGGSNNTARMATPVAPTFPWEPKSAN